MEEIQQGRFHRGQGNAFRKGHRRAGASELCGVSAKEREGLRTKKSPNTVAGSSQAISSASAVSGEIAVKLIVLSETYKKLIIIVPTDY